MNILIHYCYYYYEYYSKSSIASCRKAKPFSEFKIREDNILLEFKRDMTISLSVILSYALWSR